MQNLLSKSRELIIKIKNSLKIFLFGFTIGIVCCGVFYYNVVVNKTQIATTDVTVKPITGIPIVVEKILNKNKETTINTSYKGDGSSTITIPNKVIPSADKWDNSHWLAGGFISTDKAIYLGGGYRYDRFMIVGGPWFRNSGGYSGGIWIGGFINF